MAFQVSPEDVQVREIDVTNVVPAVSSTVLVVLGSLVGAQLMKLELLYQRKNLVSVFGEPKEAGDDTYQYCFKEERTLLLRNFLKYGNNLKVVRASNGISTGNW